MPYCARCKYDLIGLASDAVCPECECWERVPSLERAKDRTLFLFTASLSIFVVSYALFAYGEGPPTFAGIPTHRLPVWLNYFMLGVATVSLAMVPYWHLRKNRHKYAPPVRFAIDWIYPLYAIPISALFVANSWLVIWLLLL